MKWAALLQRLLGTRSGPRGVQSRAAPGTARRAIALCHALVSERGEVSGARLAREALAAYKSLDATAAAAFFDLLVDELSPDPEALWRSAVHYRRSLPRPT